MRPSPTYHPPEGEECKTSVEHGLPLWAEPAVGYCLRRPRPSPMWGSRFVGVRAVGLWVGEQRPLGKTRQRGNPSPESDYLPTLSTCSLCHDCRLRWSVQTVTGCRAMYPAHFLRAMTVAQCLSLAFRQDSAPEGHKHAPPIIGHLHQPRADGVVGGVCAQDKPSIWIYEMQTHCGQQCLLQSLKGTVGLIMPDQRLLDPFLVSSRLPFSMAVMGAVDPA